MSAQPSPPPERPSPEQSWAVDSARTLVSRTPAARVGKPSAMRSDLQKGRQFLGSFKRSLGRAVSARVKRSTRSLAPGKKRELGTAPAPSTAPAQVILSRVNAALAVIRPGNAAPADLPTALTLVAALLADAPVKRAELWLIFIAIAGRMPENDELDHILALTILEGPTAAAVAMVDIATAEPTPWTLRARLRIVDFPIVDVTLTAASPLHTGIQRVVREVVPLWAKHNKLEAVVFDDDLKCYRATTRAEHQAIFEWDSTSAADISKDTGALAEIVVPWNSTVVIPELVGAKHRSMSLECLGTWSGNRIGMTVHDFIPYTCPSIVGERVRNQFGETVNVIRSTHRVSAVSNAVRDDVDAFSVMLENLGLAKPQARAHPHPITAPTGKTDSADDQQLIPLRTAQLPIVLTVGSAVPRKNHLRLLQAVEQLWSDGLEFELVMIGWNMRAGNWLADEAAKLQARGRQLHYVGRVSDPALGQAYRLARFTVFVSLAEGYGLPVAESIASGTPVITSNFGSMREIAAGGGAMTVDPREISEIAAAIRLLLSDDAALAELTAEAQDRIRGSWDEYAVNTWEWLTG
ncbi:MAG: glycosyltransferase family 4 protein [Actinobacteria bacterium]|nr:glycosyltransferase family 4 protein [Actinomycetota bacterium]